MLGAAGARFIMNQINENNITEFGIGTGNTINPKLDMLCSIDIFGNHVPTIEPFLT